MLEPAEIGRALAAALDADLPPESPYPESLFDQPAQPAAVLIPFVRQQDGWHLIFIRRSQHPHDRHAGQVAFPGGRCDPSDPNAETAALREAREEIGIEPAQVQILGRLRDLVTITNYRVTPVVGLLPWPCPLWPQAEEVDRIFTIPLAWLAQPENHTVRYQELTLHDQPLPVIYFKEYDGELLWGATARITLLLLEALGTAEAEHRYR